MKAYYFIFISLIIFCISCKPAITPTGNYSVTVIQEDWSKALSDAKAQNKNIVLMLHADWCSICRTFIADVFTSPDVAVEVNNKIILVKIDGEKNAEGPSLMNIYGASGFPTFVIMDKDGKLIIKKAGGQSKEEFINFVKPYLN